MVIMSDNMTLKDELTLFKKVNSFNKENISKHQNYICSTSVDKVTKNQGVSRAKLRKFVMERSVDIEYWKGI